MDTLQNYHWELWNWLAENPLQGKYDWPGWICPEVKDILEENAHVKVNHCFACACKGALYRINDCGDACPIKQWNLLRWKRRPCLRSGSLYRKWDDSISKEERKALAIAIADAWE